MSTTSTSHGQLPTGWSLDGSSGSCYQNCNFTAEAEQFSQYLANTYGYDTGGLGEVVRDSPNDKFFARVDFNLGSQNSLTLRYNYIDGSNYIIGQSNDQL